MIELLESIDNYIMENELLESVILGVVSILSTIAALYLVRWLIYKGWILIVGGLILVAAAAGVVIMIYISPPPDGVWFFYGMAGVFLFLGIGVLRLHFQLVEGKKLKKDHHNSDLNL